MPIYEYRCRACGDTAEELRPLDRADAPLVCACGSEDRVRLPSLVARGVVSGGEGELPMSGGGAGGCCGGNCCA